jgi:hypothetical protein
VASHETEYCSDKHCEILLEEIPLERPKSWRQNRRPEGGGCHRSKGWRNRALLFKGAEMEVLELSYLTQLNSTLKNVKMATLRQREEGPRKKNY